MTALSRTMCAAGVVFALAGAAPASACEVDRPIVLAGLDWDSVGFHNAVASFILDHGFGCRTDVVPGTTIPLLQGMAQGDVDIAMEIWKDAVTDVWQRALRRGQVIEIGVNFPDAVQGWYVPRYVIAGDAARGIKPSAPDLKSVSDLPRYKSVFADPEEPGKGRFYNCSAGWSCEIVNTNKLRAYGLEASYTNFRSGTGAALAAAISGAYLRGEPVLAYYWSPTWVLGAYDMVMLDEPPFNQDDWQGLAQQPDYPRAVAYPKVEVWIGANAVFAIEAPQIMTFLRNYETTAAIVSDALAYMQKNDATDADAAVRFLKTHTDQWTAWVPPDVAAKVRAALDEQ